MLSFISRYEVWLYLVLAGVVIFSARLIWLARQNRSYSIFRLEREMATSDIILATVVLIIALALMVSVYFISRATPPAPPPTSTPTPRPTPTAILLLPTPTPSRTPSPTPVPTNTPLPTPSPTSSPTVTPSPLPPTLAPTVAAQRLATVTPTPDLSRGTPPRCSDPGAVIIQPGNGAQVEGVIQVLGTAMIDNFDYYKFEVRPPEGTWSYIQHYTIPVARGVLGSWNSDTLVPGPYEFRLVVVDKTGNYPAPCLSRVIVQ